MGISRRRTLSSVAAAVTLPLPRARAQAGPTIKIGVLTDMSGTYRDVAGPTSVACVRQAVQDFGSRGFTVEVVSADHQNKPDIASNIAREWYDTQQVDAIIDSGEVGIEPTTVVDLSSGELVIAREGAGDVSRF